MEGGLLTSFTKWAFRALSALLLVIIVAAPTWAEESNNYYWIDGGKTITLGKWASIDLDTDFKFLDEANSNKHQADVSGVMPEMIGSIFPKNEKELWYVLIRYKNTGHIKDDEKYNANPDQQIQSYRNTDAIVSRSSAPFGK